MIAAFCAFLLGVSKSGLKGIAALIVTGFALVYDAKNSTGVLMPLLIVGDVFAVTYYRRHVQWSYIVKLLPWMVTGVLVGVVGGKFISDSLFKFGMAGIILFSVALMWYWENKKDKTIPSHWTFASSMGILAGFTTMVGNLAGAFSNIYFLAKIKIRKPFEASIRRELPGPKASEACLENYVLSAMLCINMLALPRRLASQFT